MPGGPFQSNDERLVSEALQVANIPADFLRAQPPPLPQIRLFPPRFGYDRTPLGIADVVALPLPRGYLASLQGNQGSYSGTSTPSLGAW